MIATDTQWPPKPGTGARAYVGRNAVEPIPEPEPPHILTLDQVRDGMRVRAEFDPMTVEGCLAIEGVVRGVDAGPEFKRAEIADEPIKDATRIVLLADPPPPPRALPTEPGSVIYPGTVRGERYTGVAWRIENDSGMPWRTPTNVRLYVAHRNKDIGPDWRAAEVRPVEEER